MFLAASYVEWTEGLQPNFYHMVGMWSWITDLTLFSDRSRDVAMATNFSVKMGEIDRLTFIRRPWHS